MGDAGNDPRLIFVDTLSVARNGYLYMTVNGLHRQPDYQGGKDRREPRDALFRTAIGTDPVELR